MYSHVLPHAHIHIPKQAFRFSIVRVQNLTLLA